MDKTEVLIREGPSAERLRELLDYDPTTGLLKWKVSRGCVKAGTAANTNHNSGYLAVHVDGETYLVHRVVWCMMTGHWPSTFLDHKNGVRDDNRWGNLRLATRQQNALNYGLRQDNTSSVKGVSWHKRLKKWQARVQFGKQRLHLGYYESLDEAELAVKLARQQHHKEFTNHGEFEAESRV